MKRAILAAAFVTLSAQAEPCRPDTSFALETDWFGGVTVPVEIGARKMNLLVDTGGANSMLTETTVDGLGLPRRPLVKERVTLYGGLELSHFVRVQNITVGGAPLNPENFYVMPDNRVPYALSGTLAPDFLSAYDVEFDFAKARMNLYKSGGCPLSDDAMHLIPDNNKHLIARVEIDGVSIPAFLDTGASRSDFSLETARRLFGDTLQRGAKPALRADAEPGIYTYPFRKLTIGGVEIVEPDIVLVPDDVARRPASSPRLVLGMGVLRRLHLFVAYNRNRMSVSEAR